MVKPGQVNDDLVMSIDICATILEAARSADLIVTSGGVSVGEEDHVRIAIEELGSISMWRLRIKPGKPLLRRCKTLVKPALLFCNVAHRFSCAFGIAFFERRTVFVDLLTDVVRSEREEQHDDREQQVRETGERAAQ